MKVGSVTPYARVKRLLAREYSSRVSTVRLPTVHVSVDTTRCQDHRGRSQVWCPREGVPYHVTYPMMHMIYLTPPPTWTDKGENITFLQLRFAGGKNVTTLKNLSLEFHVSQSHEH